MTTSAPLTRGAAHQAPTCLAPVRLRLGWINLGWRLLVVFGSMSLGSACSSSELSCSSPAVLHLVQGAAADGLEKDDDYAMFDAKASTYDVSGFRTVACGEHTCECKAAVHVSLQLIAMFKQLGKMPEASGYLSMTQPRYNQKAAEFDVSYSAELSDDGKQLYVTLSGM